MKAIAVCSNLQRVVKANAINVLHGLKKGLELWGPHLYFFSEQHYLLFLLEIPCDFKRFSNNKSIHHPYGSRNLLGYTVHCNVS